MRVGFVGWRGMVGSVLRQRMTAEGDWAGLEPVFFSTSNPGGAAPDVGVAAPPLADAHDLGALAALPVIVTCQGGAYTKSVHPALRARGWGGVWIDAASALRMADDAIIVLDPLNRARIDDALHGGVRDLIGGNCTVSLMLMGMGGLLQRGWVEWMTAMTYQAASGAGARAMQTLVRQMRDLGEHGGPLLDDPAADALSLERAITARMRAADHPTDAIGQPLAGSLLPWIDSALPDGRSREEWKGDVETNRILGLDPAVPVDGLCVRIGALRCHASALTIALRQDVPMDELEAAIAETSPWTRLVPNTLDATHARLTPAATTGSLEVPIGRLRRLKTGARHITAFTVGDQLLWGAAEPVRRALCIVREHGAAALGLPE
jgi:aspartate-semialdehyde dehydrogenase